MKGTVIAVAGICLAATTFAGTPAYARSTEWSGTTDQQAYLVSPFVFFDVLSGLHQVNAFGGQLGLACGASTSKDVPKSIGLAGGGERVAATIRHGSFRFSFTQDGGRFTGRGHFTSRHHAVGTIRYVSGSATDPAHRCDSGLVRWTAAPGNHNY